MKALKLYGVFAIIILAITLIMWVMGLASQDACIEVLKKAGSVIGILFLATILLQFLTKPQSKK